MALCVGNLVNGFKVIGDVITTKESTLADVRRAIDTNPHFRTRMPEKCVYMREFACVSSYALACYACFASTCPARDVRFVGAWFLEVGRLQGLFPRARGALMRTTLLPVRGSFPCVHSHFPVCTCSPGM
jgi:hypothetical protein